MELPRPHTYGPACRLAPVEEPSPDNAILDGIPPINAQYFYHSLIPIDDPLSTATIPTSSENKASKAVLRPFSHADNNALERAWLGLASEAHRASHQASVSSGILCDSVVSANAEAFQGIVDALVQKHKERHAHEGQTRTTLERPVDALASTAAPVCCQELLLDASNLLRETFCEVTRRKQRDLDQENVIEQVMAALEKDRPTDRPTVVAMAPRVSPSVSTSAPKIDEFVLPALSTSSRGRASSLISNPPASRSASIDSRPNTNKPVTFSIRSEKSLPRPAAMTIRPPAPDDGISGKPFARAGADSAESPLETGSTACKQDEALGKDLSSSQSRHTIQPASAVKKRQTSKTPTAVVPVGVSRLHNVSLPSLQMKPIYWSPVNDIAIVSRATWFYRYVMLFAVSTALLFLWSLRHTCPNTKFSRRCLAGDLKPKLCRRHLADSCLEIL